MWRVALACVAAAGCNQVFGLDPASGPGSGDDGSNGSDAPLACEVTGCADATAPFCDPNAHTCRPCLANSECASDACVPLDFSGAQPGGSCLAATDVAYVDQVGSGSACTQASPCATLPLALATNKDFVHFNGTIASNATVNRSVTFLANPGAALVRSVDGILLAITNATGTVRIYDLEISNASTNPVMPSTVKGIGVSITGGDVTLEHVRVVNNQDVGVIADLGTHSLTVTRSTIDTNLGGGLVIKDGTFRVTNTFITHDGTSNSNQGGVELGGNPTGSQFEFNTLAENNTKNASLGGGLSCDIAGFHVPNNLLVHNQFMSSEIASNANFNASCNSLLDNSVVSTLTFSGFGFASDNDFHLTPLATMAIDKGDVVQNVKVDVDDNTRPQGSLPDLGADELMP